MLIVRPVSRHDKHLLQGSVDNMAYFGGLRNHSILFVPSPSCESFTTQIAAKLRSVCDHVAVEAIQREPEGGWPIAPNIHFRETVELLDRRGNTSPWLWMELDADFLRAGGPDRLELEYNRQGLPFFGVLRETKEVMRDETGQPFQDGQYMVGVGIYPANFKDYSTLYKSVGTVGRKGSVPFDVRIRHEVVRRGSQLLAYDTNLIEHRRSTGNYRRDTEQNIICDDYDRQEGNKTYAGKIGPMAYLVHGCKDGTLARLVIGEVSVPAPAAKVSPEPLKTQPTAIRDEAENATLLFERLCAALSIPQSSQKSAWDGLMRGVASQPPEPVRSEEEVKMEVRTINVNLEPTREIIDAAMTPEPEEEPQPVEMVPPAWEPVKPEPETPPVPEETPEDAIPEPAPVPTNSTLEKIRQAVRKAKQTPDVASLAADLGVSQKIIRDLIGLPNSGLIQDRRWVKLKDAA